MGSRGGRGGGGVGGEKSGLKPEGKVRRMGENDGHAVEGWEGRWLFTSCACRV